MSLPKISILIATNNRCDELLFTLSKIKELLSENVDCVVYDDGSADGTFEKVKTIFPEVTLWRNDVSKGYIFCRNKMLNETKADYAISLDDDAHFISANPIKIITDYFEANQECGLIATRIFWSKTSTENTNSTELPQPVKSFVGCGHIWRMKAWREIPNYPEWFQFYGEENYASLQLFKSNWSVDYLPGILVQHRVDLKERAKSVKNFEFRYRRSLRADWYNYFLCFPMASIPRKLGYSLWMQFKKVIKGNFKVVKPLFLALLDLIISFPKLMKYRKPLSSDQYQAYIKLTEAKIYWTPESGDK